MLRLPSTRETSDEQNTVTNYITFDLNEDGTGFFEIDGEKFDGEDFNIFKTIVCYQNDIELPDTSMTKELRDIMDKALEFKRKQGSSTKMADFENQIVSLAISTHWTVEYIYNLTIRKFNLAIARVDKFETWKIYTGASLSGFVSFPSGTEALQHWMCDLSKGDKYDGVKTTTEKVQGIISGDLAKEAIASKNK